MKPLRRERVASLLREEIALIIQVELKDPRVGFVSITAVEPTEDLKEAKVKVSVLGTEAQQRTTLRGLVAAREFIQGLLGDRLRFRQTPLLRFELDESIQKAMALEELMRRAKEEDDAAAAEREARARSQEPDT